MLIGSTLADLDANGRAELERLRAENEILRTENANLKVAASQGAPNERVDDLIGLLANTAKDTAEDTAEALFSQHTKNTLAANFKNVLNGQKSVACFQDNDENRPIASCPAMNCPGRCNGDCQIRPDVLPPDCKMGVPVTERIKKRYVQYVGGFDGWTHKHGNPSSGSYHAGVYANSANGCSGSHDYREYNSLRDCLNKCQFQADCDFVMYGDYLGGRCCMKKLLKSVTQLTLDPTHETNRGVYGTWFKPGKGPTDAQPFTNTPNIPTWGFYHADGKIQCPCTDTNGSPLKEDEAVRRILGQLGQIGVPRDIAARIAGGIDKGEGWNGIVGYGAYSMIKCWKQHCAVDTSGKRLENTTRRRRSKFRFGRRLLAQADCRDPDDISECHPCNNAIVAHCVANPGSHKTFEACYEHQLCSHPNTCKTGRCAQYELQLLQNNATDKGSNPLELLDEHANSAASAGWNCG